MITLSIFDHKIKYTDIKLHFLIILLYLKKILIWSFGRHELILFPNDQIIVQNNKVNMAGLAIRWAACSIFLIKTACILKFWESQGYG